MITSSHIARAAAYLTKVHGRPITCDHNGLCYRMVTAVDGSVYRSDVAYIANYRGSVELVDVTGDSDELLISLN